MSETLKSGKVYPAFVPNMAVPDTFMAPDSTARRPNPGDLSDRPRTANQIPTTAIEADLPQE